MAAKRTTSTTMLDTEAMMSNKMVEIIPKKDWHIVQNEIDIVIKQNEAIQIPTKFLITLKTEEVI